MARARTSVFQQRHGAPPSVRLCLRQHLPPAALLSQRFPYPQAPFVSQYEITTPRRGTYDRVRDHHRPGAAAWARGAAAVACGRSSTPPALRCVTRSTAAARSCPSTPPQGSYPAPRGLCAAAAAAAAAARRPGPPLLAQPDSRAPLASSRPTPNPAPRRRRPTAETCAPGLVPALRQPVA